MFIKISSVACVLFLSVCGCQATKKSSSFTLYHCSLRPTTGFNDLCGEPVFKFDPMDPRLPLDPHFAFSAMQNTDGTDPIPLTPEICEENPDSLLATWANPDFYIPNGFPLPDPRLLNVPYNQVPVVVNEAGLRAQVLDEDDPEVTRPLPPVRSIPNEADTIESFTGVSGRSVIKCFENGDAQV